MLTFSEMQGLWSRDFTYLESYESWYIEVWHFSRWNLKSSDFFLLRRQTLPRLQSAGEFYFEEQELSVALPWACEGFYFVGRKGCFKTY